MSAYYKKIDGKNYDKAMLDIADKSIGGKGDGRISLSDAKIIIKAVKDGGKITDIEKRTLNYILKKYKMTETALKHIEKCLNIDMKTDKNTDAEISMDKAQKNEASEKKKPSEKIDQPVQHKSKKGILILLLMLVLVIFLVFILFRFVLKKSVFEKNRTDNKTEISASGKTGAVIVDSITGTDNITEKPAQSNEYLVKDKDSLIKISESVYGDYKKWEDIYKLNNRIISNPTVLYPGQILTLPEKKK